MEKKDLTNNPEPIKRHPGDKLNQFTVGQFVFGRIISFKHYGAIIDIGGIEGLLHISDMAWKWIQNPGEVFALGENILVEIKEIDKKAGTVNLSCKSLLPNPWPVVEKRLKVGDLVKGVVTYNTDFGVFVKLPIGVEGLIHKSEIEAGSLNPEHEKYHKGEILLVRVISIEPQKERIGLSASRVSEAERLNWKVRKQTRFGFTHI